MIQTLGKTDQGALKIDLTKLLESRLLVQAASGGGKSWILRRIIEQTANQVQQIIIDSEGEFSTLREKFDFIIAAPHDGDAIAHPSTAALLARRLLEAGVSAVIDIYDLKAHQRQAFVRMFLDAMVNAPKKLWHPVIIFLDEAHVFAPEKGKAESAGAVIDMATRGRKRGQCLIPATQRLSKLHKDVAAECQNKLIGLTTLDIDIKRVADELGLSAKDAATIMRRLDPGDFFAYGPALSRDVVKVRIGAVQTTHPKPGQRQMSAPPAPSAKIKKVLAELADLPKEAEQEARTLQELRAELTKVRGELTRTKKQAEAGGIPETEVRRRIREAISQQKTAPAVTTNDPALRKAAERAHHILSQALQKCANVPVKVVTQQKQAAITPGTINGLRKGAVRILQELAARYPAGYSRSQVGALTKFSPKGGTFNTYLGDLRRAGFIEERDGLTYATESGISALGDRVPSAPTTHEEAMNLWRSALRAGAYRMLEAIVEAGNAGMTRTDIAASVGMEQTGGTFNTYLGDLRRNGLIREHDGIAVANNILFPDK